MINHTPEETGKGFVIIKSHAITQGVSSDILKLIKDHEITGSLKGFYLSEYIKNTLMKLFVIGSKEIIVTENSNFFYDVYPNEINKPHFQLLKQLYSGKNILINLEYDGNQEELKNILITLKGKNTIIDENGNVIVEGHGIRGHLMKPYKYISDEIFKNLSDEENTEKVSNILNNYIHTTDTKEEYERLLKYF